MEVIFWGLALEHLILIGSSLGLNLILIIACFCLCCRIRRRKKNTLSEKVYMDMTNMNDNDLGHDYEMAVIPSRATSLSVGSDCEDQTETVTDGITVAPSKPVRGNDKGSEYESGDDYEYAEPHAIPARQMEVVDDGKQRHTKDEKRRSVPLRYIIHAFHQGRQSLRPVYVNTVDYRS
ncbi:uncharacterized protein LOC121423639 [Lytechinus variegatus]|uniref:uncharacterized protein LOC121423639 n=1 Tax=Lytechinus variegatus TaxID=7654 RepID=UPI001BB1D0AB|nr:uncharacterized protein LOC121423639 [Lytechinus variegatus]